MISIKVKILFIREELPYPPLKSGVSKYQYEILKRVEPLFPNKFIIDIACYERFFNDYENLIRNKIDCINEIFYLERPVNNFIKLINFLSKSFFGYFLFKDNRIKDIINNNNYDIIYVAPERTYFNFNRNIPVFLNAMDSLSKYNFSVFKRSFCIKPILKSILWLLIEIRLIRNSTVVSYVSTRDIDYVSRFTFENNLFFSPVGVDCKLYSSERRAVFDYSILFTGNFAYSPNKDAANFILSAIFPEIKRKFPSATLWLVGMNPPSDFFGHKDVHVTGFVEDISEYYRKSSVFLCPLQIGAGMKTKILEAMASGIPVISSDIGMDGIEFSISGATHLSANLLEEYLEALSNLFCSESTREMLSTNARELITKHYDWNIVAKRLLNKIEASSNV